MNYVDMDPAENAFKDPMCHERGYDSHKGTDIAIRSKAVMDKGVNVLAAMDGTVEKLRDGETDAFRSEEDLAAIKESRKECGNAIVIDHGNALKTIYCHLKKDSITVQPGQDVKTGDSIGQIGLSGMTEFPHVHFGILWEGAVMDPFTGQSNTQGCGTVRQSLWDNAQNISYSPTEIYYTGFSTKVPDLDALDRGDKPVSEITTDEEILTFWFAAFGSMANDEINMRITNQSGQTIVKHSVIEPKTRARIFYYIGKKLENEPLQPGIYTGHVEIKRKQEDGNYKIFTDTATLTVK